MEETSKMNEGLERPVIPEEGVEAAARAMAPTVWGPAVWQFAAHGESPADARARVQKESLQDARRALEAAAPFMLAKAWDEGFAVGWDCEGDELDNPYGTIK